MRKRFFKITRARKTALFVFAALLCCPVPLPAKSNPHHAINIGRDCLNVIASPVKALLFKGPKDIKAMWDYEVWGLEKPRRRGLMRNRVRAAWMAPGVEARALTDGFVESFAYAGKAAKELISIPFGDE